MAIKTLQNGGQIVEQMSFLSQRVYFIINLNKFRQKLSDGLYFLREHKILSQ
jgi:hypothetical protein